MWRDEVKLCEAKVALAEIKMEAAKDSGERLRAETALAAAHSLLRLAIRVFEEQLQQQSQMSMGVDLTPFDGGSTSAGGCVGVQATDGPLVAVKLQEVEGCGAD